MDERTKPAAVEHAEAILEAAQNAPDSERLGALEQVYEELERELGR